MMYYKKFVAAIKTGGKVLREFDNTVYLPFGSEYSILLENLFSLKAKVWIEIDSTKATEEPLVVGPHQKIEIERYVKKDLTKGNRFKFIAMSDEIEAHRGITARDGLVVIQYEFANLPAIRSPYITQTPFVNPLAYYKVSTCHSGETNSRSISAQANNVGITVPGSISNQTFNTVADFPTDGNRHTMVFKLLGQQESQALKKPLDVKYKPKCTTCGRQNKATAKFCSSCGTSLLLGV